jgi:hypothetical protein
VAPLQKVLEGGDVTLKIDTGGDLAVQTVIAPNITTTLIRASGATGVVLTDSGGTICLKAVGSDVEVPNDLRCSRKITSATLDTTTLSAPNITTTLIRASGATGVVLTDSGGTICLKATSSDVLIPNALEVGTVTAQSFQSGKFRMRATDLSLNIERYDDDGDTATYSWQRIVAFNWGDVDGAIVTNHIRAETLDAVQIEDSLRVRNNAVVDGDLRVDGAITGAFWVAGKVDGASLAILSSKGQRGFSVQRESGFSTGVYKITFDEAHPDGANYVIQISSLFTLNYLTPAPYAANGSSNFALTLKTNNNGGLVDDEFHFTVLR